MGGSYSWKAKNKIPKFLLRCWMRKRQIEEIKISFKLWLRLRLRLLQLLSSRGGLQPLQRKVLWLKICLNLMQFIMTWCGFYVVLRLHHYDKEPVRLGRNRNWSKRENLGLPPLWTGPRGKTILFRKSRLEDWQNKVLSKSINMILSFFFHHINFYT